MGEIDKDRSKRFKGYKAEKLAENSNRANFLRRVVPRTSPLPSSGISFLI